jgi:hypothetical protein
MINFAPFISMLLRKKKTSEPREFTENDKKEIAKINEMGMFEAMDYLANKEEEKITYCGVCGGDASHCDGC